MTIHIQDPETDWLVRDFARRRGLGITAAVRLAVEEASARERSAGEELRRKIEPIVAEVRSHLLPGATFEDAMKFIDENWED